MWVFGQTWSAPNLDPDLTSSSLQTISFPSMLSFYALGAILSFSQFTATRWDILHCTQCVGCPSSLQYIPKTISQGSPSNRKTSGTSYNECKRLRYVSTNASERLPKRSSNDSDAMYKYRGELTVHQGTSFPLPVAPSLKLSCIPSVTAHHFCVSGSSATYTTRLVSSIGISF